MAREDEILKTNLISITAVPLAARFVDMSSTAGESLVDMCYRMRKKLVTDHLFCPEPKVVEFSREIRTAGSAVRAALEEGFHRLITIEVSKGIDDSGRFDHDGRFLPYVKELLYTSFGVDPTDTYHPEQVSQVVKDEPPSLFCFLDAQHILEFDHQRLRIFTQGNHRAIFCVSPPADDNTDVPTPVRGESIVDVTGRISPDSRTHEMTEANGRGLKLRSFEMISDEPRYVRSRDRFVDALRGVDDLPENFWSWDKFLDAYYEPIREAFALMPFVGPDQADDATQGFFMKLYERDLLANLPVIRGRFRDWLYVTARVHALDEWRKAQRRREHEDALADSGPAASRHAMQGEASFDADESYALSILYMTLGRVRKQLLQEGKVEHWMIFDELVVAPMIPGRTAKSRAELLELFPDQGPAFLDNRLTTVRRLFRRILPAMIPADPNENRTADERLQELLAILSASATTRLWLAFLPGSSSSSDSRDDDLMDAVWLDAPVPAVVLHDELSILLAFWLEMPLTEFLEESDTANWTVPFVGTGPKEGARTGASPAAMRPMNLRDLIDGIDRHDSPLLRTELLRVFEGLKKFAKRVDRRRTDRSTGRFEDAMPAEIAFVLYNLAGALALLRCDTHIIGLSDEQFRKNIQWVLGQPWLDNRLRPIFFATISHLGTEDAR